MVALSLDRKRRSRATAVRLPSSTNPSSVLPVAREVDIRPWPVAMSAWISTGAV
jgi:hypothetical protein